MIAFSNPKVLGFPFSTKNNFTWGEKCEQFKFKFKFIYSHLFNYNTTIREKKGRTKTLFTWSGGPRSSGVSFFCFVSPRAWKLRKPRLRAVSLFSVVRRAKRETRKWPRARLMALVSRVSRLRRSRARALPLLAKHRKKKRDCSQSKGNQPH